MFEIQDLLAIAFVVLAGPAAYLGARLVSERNKLRAQLAFAKDNGEITLKELHRVTKEDNETLKLFRMDLAEFTVERDVALARAESLERRLAEEVDLRIGFQNRAARAEEEREQLRGMIEQASTELREAGVYLENLEVEKRLAMQHAENVEASLRCRVANLISALEIERESATPKRDATGRFQKRSC